MKRMIPMYGDLSFYDHVEKRPAVDQHGEIVHPKDGCVLVVDDVRECQYIYDNGMRRKLL